MKTNPANPFVAAKKLLGLLLFTAAMATSAHDRDSKAAALRIIASLKRRKKLAKDKAADAILALWSHHATCRREKYRRHHRRLPKEYIGSPIPGITPCHTRNYTSPIATRLANFKISAAKSAICRLMPNVSGAETYTITIAPDFASVSLKAFSSKGETYSRKCTYRRTDGTVTAAIQPGWNLTVHRPGLAEVDGMPTLAAIPVETETEGEEIWRAKWAEKSRGFSAKLREGYIVRRTVDGRRYTAHGSSVAAARACITRQLPATVAAATERQRKRLERIERLRQKIAARLESGHLNGYGSIPVTVADSYAVGNCRSGTRSWVARHFPDRTSATVEEILAVRDQHERALLACLHAIIRHTPAEPEPSSP